MTYIPLDKLAETMGKSIDQVARGVKIKLFNGVIRDTRVDTGRLRGAWTTTTGKPAKESIDRLDPNGNQASSDVTKTVKGDTIDWIVNTLPYAEIWNNRDGIIDKNVARLERNIKEALKNG